MSEANEPERLSRYQTLKDRPYLAEMGEEGHRNSVRWGPSQDERDEAKTIFDGYIARGWSASRGAA
jgi:hypothetical protein